MKYDIGKQKAPEMPNLGKGTECIKLLLSQASKDMYEPLVPMFFPVLGAHVSGSEFQYPDLTWKELCGQMAHLVADSGNNKAQLGNLVEAMCRDFRQHDAGELKKLVEWSKLTKTRGANKEKPARPDVGFFFPPSDTTSPIIQGMEALLRKPRGIHLKVPAYPCESPGVSASKDGAKSQGRTELINPFVKLFRSD